MKSHICPYPPAVAECSCAGDNAPCLGGHVVLGELVEVTTEATHAPLVAA